MDLVGEGERRGRRTRQSASLQKRRKERGAEVEEKSGGSRRRKRADGPEARPYLRRAVPTFGGAN